jgi:DNA-binding NarL/FixJ family response regulator
MSARRSKGRGKSQEAPTYPYPCSDEIDVQILSLMGEGLPDSAIGKKLTLGLRTVQRRVQRMMERTSSPSRFAFGITICQIGLLQEDTLDGIGVEHLSRSLMGH